MKNDPEGPFGGKGILMLAIYWALVILCDFIRAWKKVQKRKKEKS